MFEQVAGLTLSVKSDSVKRASDRMGAMQARSRGVEESGTRLGRTFHYVDQRLGRFVLSLGAAYIGMRTLTGGINSLIRVNMEFGVTLSSVEAVTRATERQMVSLEATARKLGATTRWSASQAAEGMRFLGMAGFEVNEVIAAMPGLLDLATAGALDLGRAADIASNILSGFNMEAAESGRVADVLAAAASSSNTNVEQLGEGMKYVAPVAASLRIEIEQATAAMGVLSDAGLQASMAGTGLRRVLSELANPTSQAQEVLESYGLTLEELDPASNNLINIIERMGAVGLTAADAFTVFGDRGAPAILALTSQTDRLRELNQEMENSAGRASEMAKVMADNLAGDVKILQSAFEELLLSGGERGVNGMLRSLTQTGSTLLQAWAADINRFDPIELADKIAETEREIAKFGESARLTEKLDNLQSQFANFIANQSVDDIKALELQFGVAIDRQKQKIKELRAWAAEGGDGALFGTRGARLDQVDEAVAKLKELYDIQQVIIGAQPLVAEASARTAQAEEAEAAKEADRLRQQEEAKRQVELARKEAERQANLDAVRQSLKTEEELLRDSYQKRLELVLENTAEGSAVRSDLTAQLQTQLEEELALIEESENAKFESLVDSLMTEEEALLESYNRRKEIILENTSVTEEERMKLLSRLEKQYSDQRRKQDIKQWKDSLSAFDDFQNNLLVLARTGNKELAAIYKAAAIANTTIKTYESATSAYAALAGIPIVGPALGAAAAAAAIAAGLANIQAITSTNAGSFAEGGYIPAGQTGLVGEAGPEIITGPAEVTSARDTRRMLGESQKEVVINFIGIQREDVSVDEQETRDQRIINIAVARAVQESERQQASNIRTGSGDISRALEGSYKLARGGQR